MKQKLIYDLDISTYEYNDFIKLSYNEYGLSLQTNYILHTKNQAIKAFKKYIKDALLKMQPFAYYAYDTRLQALYILYGINDYLLLKYNDQLKILKIYYNHNSDYIMIDKKRYKLNDFIKC